jgi:hypothetical protein
MGIGSGLGGQLGFADESTYGTFVSPTRFLEFNSESIEADIARLESKGIGSGRYLRSSRQKGYVRGAAGSIELDVMTKGFGQLFKYMLGSYANTLVAGSERKATITPDANALQGVFFSTQVGRPATDGTVHPFNYEGCKITSWELKADIDDWLKLTLGIDAETEQTATALAAASYVAGAEPFAFSEGAVTINGSAVRVRRFSLKGENALKTDRRFIGNQKREPLANGEWVVSGELEFEFEDLTRHAALVAATQIEDLVITFTTPTVIAGGGPYKLVAAVPGFSWTGGTPKIGGPDVIGEVLQLKALNNGADPVVQLDYHSTDTAA